MKKGIITILPAAVFYILLLFGNLLGKERSFSAAENRLLASRPSFEPTAFWEGDYQKSFEEWVNDQFPQRERFLSLYTGMLRLMGKQEVKGVYFVAQKKLMGSHKAADLDPEKSRRRAMDLAKKAGELSALLPGKTAVMAVPEASAIQTALLPPFASQGEFNQLEWLETLQGFLKQDLQGSGSFGEKAVRYVDVAEALLDRQEEEIYYGTDHHWTTLGAFYGYQAFCAAMGYEKPRREDYQRETVSDTFLGSLYARVRISVKPDTIERWERKVDDNFSVGKQTLFFAETGETAPSLYFYEQLPGRDPYAFFMNGNHPLLVVTGAGRTDNKLLLIKDSYANCFIPFLTEHYGQIIVVDQRYYRGDLEALIQEYEPKDALFLFDVMQYIP